MKVRQAVATTATKALKTIQLQAGYTQYTKKMRPPANRILSNELSDEMNRRKSNDRANKQTDKINGLSTSIETQ